MLASVQIDAIAVCDGLGRVRVAGRCVLGLLALALALVVVLVVGWAEDGAAAGVDARGGKDGAGYFMWSVPSSGGGPVRIGDGAD